MAKDLSQVFAALPERPLDPRLPQLSAQVWSGIAQRHERRRRLRGTVLLQAVAIGIALSVGVLQGHASASQQLHALSAAPAAANREASN